MSSRDIQSLLRVKQVIDHLKALDMTTLTETERDAIRDSLQQAYDRADYVLQGEREIPMMQQPIHDPVSVAILHELDLGQHTLFIMDDGSVYLLTDDEQTGYLADNGIRLIVLRPIVCLSRCKNSFGRKSE